MKNRAVFIPVCLLAAALLAGCSRAGSLPASAGQTPAPASPVPAQTAQPQAPSGCPDYARAMADAAGPGDIDPAYTDADTCLQNAYALAAALFRGDAGAAAAACGVTAEDLAHTAGAAQDDRFPFADLTGLQVEGFGPSRWRSRARRRCPRGRPFTRWSSATATTRPPAVCRRWCRRAATCPKAAAHIPRSAASATGSPPSPGRMPAACRRWGRPTICPALRPAAGWNLPAAPAAAYGMGKCWPGRRRTRSALYRISSRTAMPRPLTWRGTAPSMTRVPTPFCWPPVPAIPAATTA